MCSSNVRTLCAYSFMFSSYTSPKFKLGETVYDRYDGFNGSINSVYSNENEWYYVVLDNNLGYRIYGPKSVGTVNIVKDKESLVYKSQYDQEKINIIKSKLTKEEIKLIREIGL